MLYLNTPENAYAVGWLRDPSRCIGRTDARYVTHDPVNRLFWFHNERNVRKVS
jgi:hypothetical protein